MYKVAVSGGFDPVHVGHIRLFKAASGLGKVYVILNSDEFLKRKKGFIFMPYKERKEVLWSIKYVHEVVDCIDEDDTVRATLKELRPDFFCNGGDRTRKNIPELSVCKKCGIDVIFGVGGKKVQSSSYLTKKVKGV